MTCLENYMMRHPCAKPEEIIAKMCPGASGEIPIKIPAYCMDEQTICYVCWNREIPCTVPTVPEAAKNTLKVMLDDGAKMPTRAHPADAGLDLYSRECCTLMPGMSHRFDTGVHVAILEGYVGMVKSRSSMNAIGLTCEGVIDSGYTGSIVVKMFNHGRSPVLIEQGQKISQLVILPCLLPDLEQVDSMEETERGNGGFGSSGKF